jgi:capsular polysaccharide biosynthesis protein
VTLAASDAGLLSAGQALDDRQAAAWVTAEAIDGADLVRLTVWQPSPAAALKLAEAIVARGLDANRRDEAEVIAPEVHRRLVVVDPPTLPATPSFPRRDVNLAAGFGIGVLIGAAFVSARQVIRN